MPNIPARVKATVALLAATVSFEQYLLPGLPAEWQPIGKVVIRVVIAALAVRNLWFNPSGESCRAAYEPHKEEEKP